MLVLGCLAPFLQLPGTAGAQRQCGLPALEQAVTHGDAAALQALREKRQAFIRTTQEAAARKGPALKTTATHPVPVVFHIILTQAQYNRIGGQAGVARRVDSQMAVLNRDFNRQNGDSTSIPSVFKPRYGNAQIRFALAQKKPDGSATPGYEVKIIQAGADSLFEFYDPGAAGSQFACSDAKYTSPKGFSAWDVNKYFNIWVCRITNNNAEGILGVTVSHQFSLDPNFPQLANEKGVVLTYGAFGKRTSFSDYYISGIDGGRTLTHETGHFFELPHIWGDDNGACPGSGGTDDGFADTPPQADEHYGCPSFPQVSCSNGPNGDMYMNYMDYTNDACMFMFSQNQTAFMNSLIQPNAQYYSLTQHPEVLSVSEVKTAYDFSIAPNPSTGAVFINFARQPNDMQGIDILNMMGQRVLQLPVNASGSYSADLSGLSKGVYLVQCRCSDGTITRKIVLQ